MLNMSIFADLDRAFAPMWSWQPPMWPVFDLDEDDDGVTITADVPGLTDEDLDVTVAGNVLTIEGRSQRKRFTGEFRRQWRLDAGLDTEHVEAALRHGVLTVRVPKTEQAKPRKIRIAEKVRNLLGKGDAQ